MRYFTWTPGDNMAVVSRNGAIILEPGHDALGPAFWQALEEGVDLGTLLQSLTSAFAADLASLPNFAAIVPEGPGTSMHIAVRGAFEVTVATDEGTSSFTSGTVITWAEQRVHNVRGVSIVSANTTSDTREEHLPTERIISSGIVPASALVCGDLSAGDAPANDTDVSTPAHERNDNERTVSEETVLPGADALLDVEDAVNRTRGFDEDDEDYISDGGDFSDLFSEHTQARSVEDAAVRNVRDDDSPFAPPTSTPAPTSLDTPDDVPTPTDPATVVDAVPWEAQHSRTTPPHEQPSFFIDEVPGRSHPKAQEPPKPDSQETPAPPPAPVTPDTPASSTSIPQSQTDSNGDHERLHDGLTLPSRLAQALQRRMENENIGLDNTTPQDGDEDGPSVMAAMCVQGHPNPTHAQKCRVCEAEMTDTTVRIPRPSLGTLVFSTGERIPLDRDVVIGRRPRYTPQPGRPEAHVVPVPSPNLEISRTHCEIKIDGWDARVRDLGSNNGTFLLRPNQQPLRVTDSVPVILRPGDVLDIGDMITIRMEV